MACTAAHNKQVEDLMASEIFVFQIEDRELKRIDDAADGIDDAAGKQPDKSRR